VRYEVIANCNTPVRLSTYVQSAPPFHSHRCRSLPHLHQTKSTQVSASTTHMSTEKTSKVMPAASLPPHDTSIDNPDRSSNTEALVLSKPTSSQHKAMDLDPSLPSTSTENVPKVTLVASPSTTNHTTTPCSNHEAGALMSTFPRQEAVDLEPSSNIKMGKFHEISTLDNEVPAPDLMSPKPLSDRFATTPRGATSLPHGPTPLCHTSVFPADLPPRPAPPASLFSWLFNRRAAHLSSEDVELGERTGTATPPRRPRGAGVAGVLWREFGHKYPLVVGWLVLGVGLILLMAWGMTLY
jgi:hypothetical protein